MRVGVSVFKNKVHICPKTNYNFLFFQKTHSFSATLPLHSTPQQPPLKMGSSKEPMVQINQWANFFGISGYNNNGCFSFSLLQVCRRYVSVSMRMTAIMVILIMRSKFELAM